MKKIAFSLLLLILSTYAFSAETPLEGLDKAVASLLEKEKDIDFKERLADKQSEKGQAAILEAGASYLGLDRDLDEAKALAALEKLSRATQALWKELRDLPDNKRAEKAPVLRKDARETRYWQKFSIPHSKETMARLWILQAAWDRFHGLIRHAATREGELTIMLTRQNLKFLIDRVVIPAK